MKAKAIGGFVLLFILYHSAEWMYMKYQSASGFLVFQFLFFLSSLVIAKFQFKEGFAAWGFVRRGFLDVSFRGNAIGTDPVWNCFRIECLVVSGGSGSMAPDFGRFGFVYIW